MRELAKKRTSAILKHVNTKQAKLINDKTLL